MNAPFQTSTTTVIIPALNEEQSIATVVQAIPDFITRIIVADNGSTDATATRAKECMSCRGSRCTTSRYTDIYGWGCCRSP